MPYESLSQYCPNASRLQIVSVKQDAYTGVWMYNIRVVLKTHQYEVSRRFSEFKKLYATIEALNIAKLPKLPESGFFTKFRSNSEELLNQRRAQLENILQIISQHEAASSLPEVRHFLGYFSSKSNIMGSNYGLLSFRRANSGGSDNISPENDLRNRVLPTSCYHHSFIANTCQTSFRSSSSAFVFVNP